jgi:hypothetical protein
VTFARTSSDRTSPNKFFVDFVPREGTPQTLRELPIGTFGGTVVASEENNFIIHTIEDRQAQMLPPSSIFYLLDPAVPSKPDLISTGSFFESLSLAPGQGRIQAYIAWQAPADRTGFDSCVTAVNFGWLDEFSLTSIGSRGCLATSNEQLAGSVNSQLLAVRGSQAALAVKYFDPRNPLNQQETIVLFSTQEVGARRVTLQSPEADPFPDYPGIPIIDFVQKVIALDDGFAILWSASPYGYVGRRNSYLSFIRDDNSALQTVTIPSSEDFAWNGQFFGLVAFDETGITFQLADRFGLAGGQKIVLDATKTAHVPMIAASSQTFGVLWSTLPENTSDSGIRIRKVTPTLGDP